MRQVPFEKTYLLIGDGRLALHLEYYLKCLGCSFYKWSRNQNTIKELITWKQKSQYKLVAISDSKIESFYKEHGNSEENWIHFSGALHIEGMTGFHPLMSFSEQVYETHFYEGIPFIGCSEKNEFTNIFPQFKNPYFKIRPDQKAIYHALCVLTGNGTTQLWESVANKMKQIGLPKEILQPYICKITENIISDSPGRFTGPWFRDDQITTSKNLKSLEGTELSEAYISLQKLALNDKGVEHEICS